MSSDGSPPSEEKPRDCTPDLQNQSDQGPLIYTSSELFQGRDEVLIEHRGEMYRLRKTSKGRLYMTK